MNESSFDSLLNKNFECQFTISEMGKIIAMKVPVREVFSFFNINRVKSYWKT